MNKDDFTMIRSLSLWIALCWLGVTTSYAAQPAAAFVQTHFDAVFWVDAAANQTTAAYGIGFMADAAADRDWVFALPPGAELIGTVPGRLPSLLAYSANTPLQISDSSRYCNLSPTFIYFDGYGWASVVEYPSERQSPELIDTATAAAVMPWARAAIDDYAAQGWTFARLPLTPAPLDPPDEYTSAQVQRSPLVLVRYPGTTPQLPLRLIGESLRSVEDEFYRQDGALRSRVIVFADAPYTSDALTQLDFTGARGPNLIAGAMQTTSQPIGSPGDAVGLYFNTLHRANGFIRTAVNAQLELDPYWVEQYPEAADNFMRRGGDRFTAFDAGLTPPLSDITFTPDAAPPADGLRYPTRALVNPLFYWGCTTRALANSALEARLPAGRTWVEASGLMLAYPPEWVESTVEATQIFAPQPVDAAALAAIERGEAEFPALLLSTHPRRYPDQGMIEGLDQDVYFAQSGGSATPDLLAWLFAPERIAQAAFAGDTGRTESFEGMQLALFVPTNATEAERSRYADLIAYAQTRQFMTSPDLRHTLYLGTDGRSAAIGYPEGWTEQVNGDEVLLLPDNAAFADSPAIRLTRFRGTAEEERAAFDAPGVITAFESEGRIGYTVTTGARSWPLAEISALSGADSATQALLRLLAESLRPYAGG